MLTIVAAMREEIGLAARLCAGPGRLPLKEVSGWQASRNGVSLHLIRTGIGPSRAAAQIGRYLAAYRPSRILVAGYGGALDPALAPGALVAVRQVSLFGTTCPRGSLIDQMELEGSWPLDGAERLSRTAERAGIRAVVGDALTSPFIVGHPAQKSALHGRFRAAVIDMESAVIARAAASAGITVSCVRAIADCARDDFLAPFSYAPEPGLAARTGRVVGAGRWMSRYRSWRRRSDSAARTLGIFLSEYLDGEATRVTPWLRSGQSARE